MKLEPVKHRPLSEIAYEIERCWDRVHPTARPYLDAMKSLNQIDGMYGLDTAESIVRYFLANATAWRGENARACREELKAILKQVDWNKQLAAHHAAYKRDDE